MSDKLKVLTSSENPILHFPDENGDAYCDTDEDLEPAEVEGGVFCNQCMTRLFADAEILEGDSADTD